MTIAGKEKQANVSGQKAKKWLLWEGDFRKNVGQIADSSIDLVFTDLPFGVNLERMSKHR